MKVSVALATYNGERYIGAQLQSIAAQAVPPDEIVVCDDGSSDSTLSLVHEFQQAVPFDVRITRNPKNLGYTRNFEKAIEQCLGDVVFICDQDDVWFPNKISSVLEVIRGRPKGPIVVINDQIITDRNLVPSGETIFSNSFRAGFNEDWLVAGSCTALNREFIELAFPIEVDGIPYDSWIHRIACALEVRVVLSSPLQYYRRHDDNASNPAVLRGKWLSRLRMIYEFGFRDVSEAWRSQEQLARVVQSKAVQANSLGWISDTRTHAICRAETERAEALKARLGLVQERRLGRLPLIAKLFLAGGYRLFGGFLSALKDFVRARGVAPESVGK